MEVSAEKAKLLVTNASVFHNFTVNENSNWHDAPLPKDFIDCFIIVTNIQSNICFR